MLVSECADIRHILKSLADLLPLKNGPRKHPLNIYIHDKNLENLARALVFLTIVCESGYAKRERMELFLDLYANCLIRDKTNGYLQGIVNELIQLVTEDDRCQSVLKEIVNFNTLKFKERDDLEDVVSSYYDKHPFDIEKGRDDRMRAHFKERFDARKNVCDWDYSFYVKKIAPDINNKEYIGWRLNGMAFDYRLASNKVPNRTFSSYIPGSNRKTKDKVMVRGFWGDIIQSPYIPFGVEITEEPERSDFKKKINYQQVYSSADFSCYNVQHYITKLEDLKKYKFPFSRIKQV